MPSALHALFLLTALAAAGAATANAAASAACPAAELTRLLAHYPSIAYSETTKSEGTEHWTMARQLFPCLSSKRRALSRGGDLLPESSIDAKTMDPSAQAEKLGDLLRRLKRQPSPQDKADALAIMDSMIAYLKRLGVISPPARERPPKAKKARPPVNSSGLTPKDIHFPENYGAYRPEGARLCSGPVSAAVRLDSLEPIRERLKTDGAACIPADFDGNGYLDFAFPLLGWNDDRSSGGLTDVVVLMFGPKGWEKTLELPQQVNIYSLQIYEPRQRPGEFGEPATPVPGLIQSGEGGPSLIFLHKDESFQVTEHAGE